MTNLKLKYIKKYTSKNKDYYYLRKPNQKQILIALKDVIETCVYDEININELAMFDLEALFLKLRGKSVGETTEIKVK